MFHLLTHAFFKALLFLGSGSVIHAMGGEQDMRFMGGLKNKIKTTHITFLIGTLAISGMPFFSGMISKDEILTAAYAKNPIFWVIMFLIAMMTAIYMFRLYYLTFHGKFRGTEEQEKHLHESPLSMTLPLILLAIASVTAGFLNLPTIIGHGHFQFLEHWLHSILTDAARERIESRISSISHTTEYILMGATVLMFLAVWFSSHRKYTTKAPVLKDEHEYTGWERLSARKLYIDEIYHAVFVKTVEGMGRAGKFFDKNVLDRTVNFIGDGAEDSGDAFKRLQNGNVEIYVLMMSLAVGIMLFAKFILQ